MSIFYKKVKARIEKRQGGGAISGFVGSINMGEPGVDTSQTRFSTKDPMEEIFEYGHGKYLGAEEDEAREEKAAAEEAAIKINSERGEILGDSRARGSKLMSAWRKMKGSEEGFDKFVRLLGSVSFAETKRKNIKTKAEGGTANGYFQFIDDAFDTNQQRAKNAIKDYGLDPKLFDNILNAKNVEDLGVEDQALMALLHMNYSKKIPLSGFLAGQNSEEDIYRGWVGDVNGKVYKNDEHIKNWRQKKVDATTEGVNSDGSVLDFLWGKKVPMAQRGIKIPHNTVAIDNTRVKSSRGIMYGGDRAMAERKAYEDTLGAVGQKSRVAGIAEGLIGEVDAKLVALGKHGDAEAIRALKAKRDRLVGYYGQSGGDIEKYGVADASEIVSINRRKRDLADQMRNGSYYYGKYTR